jgi:hypothetical protein
VRHQTSGRCLLSGNPWATFGGRRPRRQLRERGLQTDEFPTATFSLTEPIRIEEPTGFIVLSIADPGAVGFHLLFERA